MPSLANMMEDYRNWRGRQEWQDKKGWEEFYGGDSEMQERAERMMGGFGTDAGGLVGMIKASHGSPHMFDKFDFSKIGTGEGAQAYGHGGYFAQGFDSPVANMYADALGSKNQDLVNAVIDRVVQTHGGNTAKIKSELLSAGLPNERITPELETSIARIVRGTDPSDGTVSSSALKEYDSLQSLVPNEKHLYNVELKWPDAAREASDPLGEHHLLDWFEPLSKQSEHVKKSLRDYATLSGKEHYVPEWSDVPVYIGEGISPDTRGKEFYEWLASQPLDTKGLSSRKLASGMLKAFDVPGIKYLDEGSRGAGKGTRNYVMFDDKFPNIVSRNGASLSDLLDTSYQSGHTAPGPDFGAQLHDLTGGGQMYPQDIYSKNAARLYGHGGSHEAIDKKAMSLVQMLRNQPEALVDIYRAVPKNESISSINPGDWVTITKEYAKEHGEGPLGGDYKILKQKVPAKSIWTNADSIHEYGYWPDQ